MSKNSSLSIFPGEFNKSVLILYLILFAILCFLGLAYLAWKGKILILAALAAVPVAVLLITRPKLAVGLFILTLFYSRSILFGQSLLVADIAGIILIAAAALDYFSDSEIAKKLPPLSLNFLSILLVILFAAVFSYDPVQAVSPFGRVTLLFLYFLSIYRLSAKVPLSWSLNFFFWVSIIHSIYVIIPFLSSRGTVRSYGFAPVQAPMLTFVIATAKYLWSKKGTGWIYLASMVVLLFALFATQYRSFILFSGVFSLAVIWFSSRRAKSELRSNAHSKNQIQTARLKFVRSRPVFLLAGLVVSVVGVVLLNPQLLAPLIERFGLILDNFPSGSVLLRITLWKQAWSQFVQNPLTGIGPGIYTQVENLDPAIRLNFYHMFIRGLSAHNLILHYLAETGILGGIAVLSMMINQMRLSYCAWQNSKIKSNFEVSAILLGISITILATTLSESSWFWGQASIVFAFFAALIARNYQDNPQKTIEHKKLS